MKNTLPPPTRPWCKAILLIVTNVQLIIYKQVTVEFCPPHPKYLGRTVKQHLHEIITNMKFKELSLYVQEHLQCIVYMHLTLHPFVVCEQPRFSVLGSSQ